VCLNCGAGALKWSIARVHCACWHDAASEDTAVLPGFEGGRGARGC
jgi:hypothetical protein